MALATSPKNGIHIPSFDSMDSLNTSIESANHSILLKTLIELFAPSFSTRNSAFRLLIVGNDLNFANLIRTEVNSMKNWKRSLEISLLHNRPIFEKVSGIEIVEGEFLNYTSDRLFDAVVYLRTLRLANPLPESIMKSKMLLKEGGIFVSEEYTKVKPDKDSFRWFFDSMDLLEASQVFTWQKSVHFDEHPPATVVSPTEKRGHKKTPSFSVIFKRGHRKTPSTVTEGDYLGEDLKNSLTLSSASNNSIGSSHSSNSSSSAVSPTSVSPPRHNQPIHYESLYCNVPLVSLSLCQDLDPLQRWEKFHEGDKMLTLSKEETIVNQLQAVYGMDSVEVKKVPYYYHFLSNGLSRALKQSLTILHTFCEMEERRIKEKSVKPLGMIIVARNL